VSRHPTLGPLRLVALLVATTPAGVAAQSAPSACRPLIEAEKKQIMSPHHAYVTEHASGPIGKEKTYESISTGDVTYIQIQGSWRRSPIGPRDLLVQLEQNLTTAKTYSCQKVGTESVGGVAATVFTAHTENESVVGDTRTWIANGTGLPVRQEEDLDTGMGDKRHMLMRYEYANVYAPAGVK
jgi:hypothetical protein